MTTTDNFYLLNNHSPMDKTTFRAAMLGAFIGRLLADTIQGIVAGLFS